MKLGIVRSVFLVTLLVVASPVAAFSKEGVDRGGFVSADGLTAVYTLSVMIGGFSEDIYVPVVGQRDVAHGTRGTTYGFHIESGADNTVSTDGEATSLLIAPAEIVDGMYIIPAGTYVPALFVSVFSVTEDESNIYRYGIQELPFFVGDDRLAQHYSTGELKYMVTNFESVNFTPDPE